MTAILPIRRTDQGVAPAPSRITPGVILRTLVFAALLTLSCSGLASAAESTPEASPAPTLLPSAEMPRLVLALEELNDSGITGTVTLHDAGNGKTIVEFDVQGAGGDHPAHIHKGTCGDLDPKPYKNLKEVNKEGESMSVVDVSLSDLLADDYAIDMHLAPNELGTLIACANIEGEPELVANATPGASPEATPNAGIGGTIATETPKNPGTAVTETPAVQGNDGTGGAQTTEITGQGDATTSNSGDGTNGAGTTTPTQAAKTVPVGGDGTAGVSGKGEPVNTETLPQQAGVGTALAWPEGPALTTMVASLSAAILLGAGGFFVRRGEHQTSTTPSRWNRLGI